MNTLEETICRVTQSQSCELGDVIQSLWSGYGVIQRVTLANPRNGSAASDVPAIVKHIDISQSRTNARGWDGDVSHQRKVRSYQIEKTFYESYAARCGDACRVPNLLGACELADATGWVLVLEDLDAAGFDIRKNRVSNTDVNACLSWLANFHGAFMSCEPIGLWPIGTYWHLNTRPQEWEAMNEGALKQSAKAIDKALNGCRFNTLVHGDAKLANFCFSDQADQPVAAVDFQYVGGGCGMKDVAYFISSFLDPDQSQQQHDALLKVYFEQLRTELEATHSNLDIAALEAEWRELYPFAWADFCRFLSGWSPGHWKMNDYNDRLTQSVIDQLSDS